MEERKKEISALHTGPSGQSDGIVSLFGRVFGTDLSIDTGEMKRTKSCSANSSVRVSWNCWSWVHLIEKASDEIAGRLPCVDDEECY
jgi:hypothetical protein